VLSDVVADQVVRLRRQRGMTREELAERCIGLGAAGLTTAALGNIETGRRGKDGLRRREVTVDELTTLARALGVPPLLLVLPVGHSAEVEVTPGATVPTWSAAQWFSGETGFPVPLMPLGPVSAETGLARSYVSGPEWTWEQGAAPLVLYRRHGELVRQWFDGEDREDAQRELHSVREELRRHGLVLPSLAPDIAREVDQ
jgi:transcriptional regulator with XRE-family HTH domain